MDLKLPAPSLDFLNAPLTLDHVEIRELVLPQVESFRSAIGVRNERRALYVRWFDRQGNWGIGECSCRPDPYFSGEFVDAAHDVLSQFLVPALPAVGTLAQAAKAVGRVRGWPFTCAALLDAANDLLRRRGLDDLLALWPGERLDKVPVGISLGLFATPDEAVERVQKAVDEGYRRVKLKVSPSMDPATVEAIRGRFDSLYLGFDANGSCNEDDFGLIERLADLSPKVFEQPFAPQRLDLCQRLKRHLPDLRLCLDESITGLGSLRSAHAMGALDEVNIKPGRVGGPLATLELLDACGVLGLPAWVGGMFESGVGRLANLRLAARLPDAIAHDLSPSRRYFACDVLQKNIEMDAQGYVDLHDDAPPLLDEDTFERLTVRRHVARPA